VWDRSQGMGVGVTITIAEKIALKCPEINSSSTILYLICGSAAIHFFITEMQSQVK